MGLLASTEVFRCSIKGYGEIAITYKLPTSLEADRIFTDGGNKWDKETVFRALVTKVEVEKAPEICDADTLLNAPGTLKAFWGCFNDIISNMWLDDDSKN